MHLAHRPNLAPPAAETAPRRRHAHSLVRRRIGRPAFTLLELLLAMTMAAIVAASLYAALRIGFRAESSAEAAVEPVRTAELAMSLLRPDFESAVAPAAPAPTATTGAAATATAIGLRGAFTGMDEGGDGGASADTLEFYTLGDPLDLPPVDQGTGFGAGLGMNSASGSTSGGSYRPSGNGVSANSSSSNSASTLQPSGTAEVRMIDLLLVPSQSGNVLVRRVTTNLLSTGTPTSYDEVVCRGVASFNLRYFDGSTWQDSWDSTILDNNCPTAVEVTLDLQRTDGDQARVVRFVRVFLLSCSGLWSPTTTTGTTSGSTGQ